MVVQHCCDPADAQCDTRFLNLLHRYDNEHDETDRHGDHDGGTDKNDDKSNSVDKHGDYNDGIDKLDNDDNQW